MAAQIHETCAPWLLGRNPLEIEKISHHFLDCFVGSGTTAAVSQKLCGILLRGVSTRHYAAVIPEMAATCGVSKSSVSREFVEASAEKLQELGERRFDEVDLLVIYLDGVRFGAYHVIAAIGVDAEGNKHVLGLREGATENAVVVKGLLEDLVERGVPFVTINWGGWDHHTDCIGAMKSMLPILDPAFATLLEDLQLRGLLDSTIVYWTGEFGRQPKLQGGEWKGGRHHWPDPTPVVIA